MSSFTHYPLLSLDRWRAILGYNPWHFWGLKNATIAPETSKCNALVYQYAWQGQDAAGRDDILEAISQAENKLFRYLEYWPAPRYSTKVLQWPVYPDKRVDKLASVGGDWHWGSMELEERYVQSIGVETFTEIEAGAAVVYSDTLSEGVAQTFTVTVAAGSLTDTTQIELYFASADRLGEAISPRWQIRPVKIVLTGGNFVITGKRWLMVKPALYEISNPNDLDLATDSNFASTVDVYRRYIDPTGTTVDTAQAKVIWETRPFSGYASLCDPVSNSTDPAALAYATARAGIRDAKLGLVNPAQAVYNATSGIWCTPDFPYGCQPPSRVEIRYQAGFPLVNGQMDERMEKAVAFMATAELERRICACDTANRKLYNLQFDLTMTGGRNGEVYGGVTQEDMSNPFGRRRGHVEAWLLTKDLWIRSGFSPVVL